MSSPGRYHKEITDSTQNDARFLIYEKRAHHGDICTASYQSAGRGRLAGRIWEGEKDQALMMTLILEKNKLLSKPFSPDNSLPGPPLSLILGLALSRSIERAYSLNPRVKWPNDIYLQNRKAAGILCESEKQYYLCGMGINLNQETFPLSIRDRAVSLKQILGRHLDQEDFIVILKEEVSLLLEKSVQEILDLLASRLCWQNEEKTLLLGDPGNKERLTGIIRGLNHDGALLFEVSGKIRKIYSAEFI